MKTNYSQNTLGKFITGVLLIFSFNLSSTGTKAWSIPFTSCKTTLKPLSIEANSTSSIPQNYLLFVWEKIVEEENVLDNKFSDSSGRVIQNVHESLIIKFDKIHSVLYECVFIKTRFNPLYILYKSIKVFF